MERRGWKIRLPTLGTLVDALMTLEAVVEVAMKGGGNLEPILEGVLNLGSSRPVTRLI